MFTGKCPNCSGKMYVAEYKCADCATRVKGNFGVSPLSALEDDDLDFAVSFLVCEGNIKAVERHLRISYPTVKSRLRKVIEKLGFKVEVNEEEVPETPDTRSIIEDLHAGKFDVAEALSRLLKNDQK